MEGEARAPVPAPLRPGGAGTAGLGRVEGEEHVREEGHGDGADDGRGWPRRQGGADLPKGEGGRPRRRCARVSVTLRGDRTVARTQRDDLVDACVLEVLGLVREQGWLADRALERVLRRERRLYASERRAVAEAVYGILRLLGQFEWLLGRESRPD